MSTLGFKARVDSPARVFCRLCAMNSACPLSIIYTFEEACYQVTYISLEFSLNVFTDFAEYFTEFAEFSDKKK